MYTKLISTLAILSLSAAAPALAQVNTGVVGGATGSATTGAGPLGSSVGGSLGAGAGSSIGATPGNTTGPLSGSTTTTVNPAIAAPRTGVGVDASTTTSGSTMSRKPPMSTDRKTSTEVNPPSATGSVGVDAGVKGSTMTTGPSTSTGGAIAGTAGAGGAVN